ncbi:MAG: chemotaxis-specific protein-glutamate methyltransferase CheB [Burkholderiaceae bacterium]|nr:chemotaxis-specific protein-glutamate methyltransferase CheB [Burkholderiaceae bacterium]
MGKIRVVIADDSNMARGLLRAFLDEPDIEIVGEASNGRQAVELTRNLKPDLVIMDLEMPVMSGLDAIDEIMQNKGVPILVVSGVADAHNALVAMERGALEVVNKPDYSSEQAAEFVAKVRMLAGVLVITRMRARKPLPAPEPMGQPLSAMVMPPLPPTLGGTSYSRVFAIACSTGGPPALAKILSDLPAGFPSPVLIAQHISDGFASGMVAWLAQLCPLPVRLAVEGDYLQAGVVYISPSERHLCVLPNRRLSLMERGPLDVYRPSCNVLLNSVADVFGYQAIGIILTGMGSDGAQGMARIRSKGGMTLGQNEESSVIYGMNRVAIEAGDVYQVISVDSIAATMVQLANPDLKGPSA